MKRFIQLIIFLLIFISFPQNTNATILFEDNFDSGSMNQWTFTKGDPTYWRIQDGKFGALIGNPGVILDTVAGNISSPNYVIEMDMYPIQGVDKNIDFRWSNDINKYEIHFNDSRDGNVRLKKNTSGQIGWTKITNYNIENNKLYHLKLILNNQHIQFYINEYLLFDETDTDYLFNNNEKIGLRISTGSNFPTEIWFDNIIVKSIDENNSLPVPSLKQTDELWKSLEYDSASHWSPDKSDIEAWGCAIVSASMVFQYHGLLKMTNESDLNPASINNWLKEQKDGYIGNGLVNWIALTRLSKLLAPHNNLQFHALEFDRIDNVDKSILATYLNNKIPVILEEPGHFIVAKGISDNTFIINDPYYSRSLLTDGYNNTFISMLNYIPSKTDLSYIMIITNPNTTLNIVSNNSSIQKTYIQQPIINPIKKNNNTNENYKIIYYKQPSTEKYLIEVLNEKEQYYNFELFLYDNSGNVKKIIQNGLIGPDNIDRFELDYNKESLSDNHINQKVTFNDLKADIILSGKLGYIKKDSVTKNLLAYAKRSEKFSIKNKGKAIKELNNLMYELEKQKNRSINTIAYKLILLNAKYLHNQLQK